MSNKVEKEKRSVLLTPGKIAVITVLLFSLSVFTVIAHEVVVEKEDWFDSNVFAFLKSYSSPVLVQSFKFLTFFGSTTFLIPGWLVLVAISLAKRNKHKAIAIALLATTSTLLMYGLKAAFARHRPPLPLFDALTDYSFPSGHALSSLVFFGTVTWLVWQSAIAIKWKWTVGISLLLFTCIVGISRIVLRYHYASDVMGGFSAGLCYVLLFYVLSSKSLRMN